MGGSHVHGFGDGGGGGGGDFFNARRGRRRRFGTHLVEVDAVGIGQDGKHHAIRVGNDGTPVHGKTVFSLHKHAIP